MPDPHSGPAFTNLVGLAMLAAGGSGDIRDLALGTTVDRKSGGGFVSRLMNALKQGY